jgi:hypoxanthine phosphoribosyltransferase
VKLEGVLPESIRLDESPSRVVSWDEYWQKIELVGTILNQAHAQGHYDPDVLVGISNGGLLFADSILRIAYANAKPFLTFWAHRKPGAKYFENQVNYALLSTSLLEEFRKTKANNQKVEFLVFDDMLGSGTTFNQLLEFLETNIPDWQVHFHLRFIFLYASSETRVEQIRQYLLTEHPIFRDRLQHLSFLTDKRELPYRKELAYGDIAESLKQDVVATDAKKGIDAIELKSV